MKLPEKIIYDELEEKEELPLLQEQTQEETSSSMMNMKVETEVEKVEKQLIVSSNMSNFTRPAAFWLIPGYIPKGPSVGQIYGPSGAGKTFAAVDIGATLASGLGNWQGVKCKTNCKVAYLTKEGQRMLPVRFKAWTKFHHVDDKVMDNNLFFLDVNYSSSVYMDMNSDDYKTLLQNLQDNGPFDIIFLDTYAEFSKGRDENSKETGQEFVDAMNKMAHFLQACIIMIHHPKKFDSNEQKDPFYLPPDGRGSGVVKGALDVQISIGGKVNSGDKTKPGTILLTVVKNKDDGNEGKDSEIALTSKIITFPEYGKDEWGRELTSLVLIKTKLIRSLDEHIIKLKCWIEERFDDGTIPYKIEQRPTKFLPDVSVSFNSEDLINKLPEYLTLTKEKPKSRRELMIIINPEQPRLIGNLVKAGLLKYIKVTKGQYVFTTVDNYIYPEGGTWEIDELEKIKEEIAEQQQKELQKLQSQ